MSDGGTALGHCVERRPEAVMTPGTVLMRTNGACVWLTGLSGAGKSTIAAALVTQLHRMGTVVTLLDGDLVRRELSPDLGFSKADRDTQVRRIGFVAREVVRHGGIVVCATISPYREARDGVRHLIGAGHFVEVYVDTPLSACERRDVKGLYAKARRGDINQFTGISDPYEPPYSPELRLDANYTPPDANAGKIVVFLRRHRHLDNARHLVAACAPVPIPATNGS